MSKKFILLVSLFLIGCGGDPTPSPTPTPSVDTIGFNFNPTDDNSITISNNEERDINISLTKQTDISKVKTISWKISDSSTSYISKLSETENHLSIKIKGLNNTSENNPAKITVTIVSNTGGVTYKNCYVYVCNPCEAKDLTYTFESPTEGYYSNKQSGSISKGKRYKFTATYDGTHKFIYFGMCDHAGSEPYFVVNYKNTSSKVNVTRVYKNNIPIAGSQLYKYGDDLLILNRLSFVTNDTLTIECTINENLTEGLWAYIGSP